MKNPKSDFGSLRKLGLGFKKNSNRNITVSEVSHIYDLEVFGVRWVIFYQKWLISISSWENLLEWNIGWNLLIHIVEPEKEEENYEFSISLFLLWHNHKYQ